MKSLSRISALTAAVLLSCLSVFSSAPRAGFFLEDPVREMTLKYRSVQGLIVLPFVVNDSLEVNLILDTGCRNLILFGKRFRKFFKINPARHVEFSGLGNGKPVKGALSIDNKVSMKHIRGVQIPVIIVNNNNLLESYHRVDGVIGYEIFLRFEIELNPKARTITFRPAFQAPEPSGFTRVPLHVVDARPVMESTVYFNRDDGRPFELMIDTGSSLGLLLKTTDLSSFDYHSKQDVLGVGLNGPVLGYAIFSRKVIISGLEIEDITTGIVLSPWHNNASIGMDVLKDYIVVLNYGKSYAAFKRNDV